MPSPDQRPRRPRAAQEKSRRRPAHQLKRSGEARSEANGYSVKFARGSPSRPRNPPPDLSAGANGAPSPEDEAFAPTVEERIKAARLEQIALSNAEAREEAAGRSGRYVLAEDARQEAGRTAGQMVALFETSLGEFANVIAAKSTMPSREALSLLRAAWRKIRSREAARQRTEAKAMPDFAE